MAARRIGHAGPGDPTIETVSADPHPAEGFPLIKFLAATAAHVVGAVLVFKWLAPQTFAQELADPGRLLLITFLLGLPMSLFEYFYHRYLLHSAVLPFLSAMHDAHSEHHGLTNVRASVRANEPEKLVPVRSDYPVVHEHQEASQMFPLFSLGLFYLVFGLALAWPLKAIFPNEPILMGTLIAVTLYYSFYELWHAVLHLPVESFWNPLMEKGPFRNVVRHIYGFHLMHHWRPTSNLAVVGFWGVAIWDHLFRTHRRPSRFPLQDAQVNYHDGKLAKPLWPIRMLDRAQGAMNRGSRMVERRFLSLLSKLGLAKRPTAGVDG